MIYDTAKAFVQSPSKRVLFFGMSGLGKTHVSDILRDGGEWFHYSVDYRIGTRYMGEHIADNFKQRAMRDPFLAELLRSDSIYIASNITFNNLSPLSTYLGKPGDPARGGLPFAEYQRRQALHHAAEIAALLDTRPFIDRARQLYGYDHFVCDSGGSICEVVDPSDPNDPVLQQLADTHLMVWIEGSEAHTQELIRRFDNAPKPMCYEPAFLEKSWKEYLSHNKMSEQDVNPDDFIRWTYARAMAHRQPRYRAMAENWGVSVKAEDLATCTDAAQITALIGRQLA